MAKPAQWRPVPCEWMRSVAWHSLSAKARDLLFRLWMGSEDGLVVVPMVERGGELRPDYRPIKVLAVTDEKPSRLASHLSELVEAGFLLERLPEGKTQRYELNHWRSIVPRWRGKRPANARQSAGNLSTRSQQSPPLEDGTVLYSSYRTIDSGGASPSEPPHVQDITEATRENLESLFQKRGLAMPSELVKSDNNNNQSKETKT